MLSPEHFTELFHGHFPQLYFLPVHSAAVTRGSQGHRQRKHRLFPLLLRLIQIMFHSLLVWKYQLSPCKSKPRNYSWTLLRRDQTKHLKDGRITPPQDEIAPNKYSLVHCQQSSLMQHSEEFSNGAHFGLAAAEAALRRTVQPVSSSLSVV